MACKVFQSWYTCTCTHLHAYTLYMYMYVTRIMKTNHFMQFLQYGPKCCQCHEVGTLQVGMKSHSPHVHFGSLLSFSGRTDTPAKMTNVLSCIYKHSGRRKRPISYDWYECMTTYGIKAKLESSVSAKINILGART